MVFQLAMPIANIWSSSYYLFYIFEEGIIYFVQNDVLC